MFCSLCVGSAAMSAPWAGLLLLPAPPCSAMSASSNASGTSVSGTSSLLVRPLGLGLSSKIFRSKFSGESLSQRALHVGGRGWPVEIRECCQSPQDRAVFVLYEQQPQPREETTWLSGVWSLKGTGKLDRPWVPRQAPKDSHPAHLTTHIRDRKPG